MSRTLTFVALLPRNICVAILNAYRSAVSPLYGDVCRYYPSCSAYALEAIQHHGVARGILLGSRRIARCHPWAAGGIDDVPLRLPVRHMITGSGFVTAMSFTSGHGKG